MKKQRLAGIVLLVVGGVLLLAGINPWNSLPDHVSESIAGALTRTTTWCIALGIASTVLGLLMAFTRLGRRFG